MFLHALNDFPLDTSIFEIQHQTDQMIFLQAAQIDNKKLLKP